MTERFKTIVADPPWPYAARMTGTLHGRHSATPRLEMRPAPLPYGTMSVGAIRGLAVGAVAEQDAHLYLWTTQRFLKDAFTVLDSWGFRVGAVLVWAKPPKGVVGTYVSSAEFCLFSRRGSLPASSRHIGTVFHWPRGKHSAKPEQFQDLVEKVSPGPYLELFARRQRLGWSVWGNEVDSDIEFGATA